MHTGGDFYCLAGVSLTKKASVSQMREGRTRAHDIPVERCLSMPAALTLAGLEYLY
jgi:hypothetical protein